MEMKNFSHGKKIILAVLPIRSMSLILMSKGRQLTIGAVSAHYNAKNEVCNPPLRDLPPRQRGETQVSSKLMELYW